MKNLTNKSIKKAIVATVAMAGLIAGTAACGGSNTTSAEAEKQALVELLLDAARNGASEGDIAEIIAEADPNLIAQVLPEVTDELDVVVPEMGTDEPAAPEAGAPEASGEIAPEEVAPEASAPEASAPDASAPEASAPEAEDETEVESGSESDFDLGDMFPDIDLDGFDPDFDLDIPEITIPDLGALTVTAPNVEFASFWDRGVMTEALIIINEGSGHVLSNITSVKLSYKVGFISVIKNAVFDVELDNNIFRWKASNTNIKTGTEVTITVTNAFGLTDTFKVTAEVSAPL